MKTNWSRIIVESISERIEQSNGSNWCGPGTELAEQWGKDRRAELDAGRLRALLAVLPHPCRDHARREESAFNCVFGHRHQMRYQEFRARGPCVSSGAVEVGCKQLGARLKRAGIRWNHRRGQRHHRPVLLHPCR